MDALLSRNLPGEHLDGQLGVLEREVVGVHLGERHAAVLDQPDGGLVGPRGHAEGADDVHLLHDDEVAHEVGDRLETLHPGKHDPPTDRDVVECLGHRHGRVGGDLDHHVGAAAGGQLLHPPPRVLRLDVDHMVGAELACECELLRVAREPRDDDRVGTGGARGDHARQPALPRTEDEHGVARARVGQLDRPAKPGTDRVEEDGQAGGDVLPHPVHQ